MLVPPDVPSASRAATFWRRLLLAGLVTLLAALLLGALGDLRDYGRELAGTDYLKLWPVLLLATCWQVLRAYRIGALLSPRPRLLDLRLYRISALHMLLASTLPLRSGEAALPVLLKAELGVGLARSTGTLLAIRLYDLLTLLVIASTVLLSLRETSAIAADFFLPSLAALIAAGTLLFVAPFLAQRCDRWLHPREDGRRWIAILRRLLEGLVVLRPLPALARVIAASFLIWAAVFASFVLSLEAVAPGSDFRIAVVSGAASSLAVAQPVNGVAGLGVVQVAWAAPARALGLSWDAAVASGIVHHLVQILAAVFNSLIALGLYLLAGHAAARSASPPLPQSGRNDPEA
jgi:hypothetical protein